MSNLCKHPEICIYTVTMTGKNCVTMCILNVSLTLREGGMEGRREGRSSGRSRKGQRVRDRQRGRKEDESKK